MRQNTNGPILKESSLLKELKTIMRAPVKLKEPMSEHTSFRTGGPAAYFVEPGNNAELESVINLAVKNNKNYFVLGNGSNILVPDKGINGIVIKLKGGFSSLKVKGPGMVAGAAVKLSALLKTAIDNGLGGLEFFSGIPGTVGGAVISNAGTSEGCIGEVLEWVELISRAGRIRRIPGSKLGLTYRNSRIPEGTVITSVGLKLKKSGKAGIVSRVKSISAVRKKTQPAGFSAGSVFKNPPGKLSAGKLIEAAGLKGKTIGGAVVSPKHANFIINKGSATSEDVLELMKLVRNTVKRKHGIYLEQEIVIIGGRKKY